jgi:predicted Zn-dependent protease with MMP-like domain
VVDVGMDEFERLVGDAIDDVPEPFASALDEVAVVVEERSPANAPDLYGLYTGVPLVEGALFSGALPARIAIYLHPLADHCRDRAELSAQVRVTVLHELGHHLGLDEDRLDELGYA